jgi:uncharacterized protein (TIGR02757 family)
MNKAELKEFLDLKASEYNHPGFLDEDPIQVPHRFTQKEDIEISAFLTATIAWGNRTSIIRNANRMMELMDMSPYEFVMNHQETDLLPLKPFVHRTFKGEDLTYFVKGLDHLYRHEGGLEGVITRNSGISSTQNALSMLKKTFFSLPHPPRTLKHLSDPAKGSAAKRLNMVLRWMVRDNSTGVDFGLWEKITPSQLSCPLDVPSGKVARRLGLLKRKQNDANAVRELDEALRHLDPIDPVKYDFALFGLGVFEKWS